MPKVIDKGKMSYLDKEDYGKIPQYLSKVKDEIRQENEMIDRYVKEQMGGDDDEPERFERLSEIERASLLTQLKQKWDTINASYQCITHLVVLDTRGQARRKENLERELETVEADIEKLNRVGPMFIKY